VYGDFSRGHEPDRRRGRSYRRVLLQMGRPVLDSDLAASTDALLGEVRTLARELGCAAGSSDLGFLITAGRLLSVFAESWTELTVTAGAPDVWLDYRHRLLGRYPALFVGAGAAAATVSLPSLQPLDPSGPDRAALWARVEAPVTITVNDVPVALVPQSPDTPSRAVFPVAADLLDPVRIGVPAGAGVWLFQLEQDEDAGDEPVFWAAPGTYQTDGLITSSGGGAFPFAGFPADSGFEWTGSPVPARRPGILPPVPAAGDRLVAYLETWERTITAVEDPGIQDVALGSADTSVRAALLGQLKVAVVTGPALPADPAAAAASVRAAFTRPEVSGGEVAIDIPPATASTDPCALPEISGYSGPDNRLYRLQVHDGGDLSTVLFTWSRDNASELFTARIDGKNLVVGAGTALADGDLVELLSDVVDLGDAAIAQVSTSGFVPARRATGQLVQLVAVPAQALSDDVAFRLVDPENPLADVTVDDQRYGDLSHGVLKLRRWHGLLRPASPAFPGGTPGPFVLESGVTVELTAAGAYRPGQWWQYEARVPGENANGPWRPGPHGPERRFAPLALLEYEGAGQPMSVLAWLDDRFSHPCDLLADDAGFEGRRVGSLSHTVQEALEELFERPPEIVDASCGEIIIRPQNTDLQAVFDTIPERGSARLCLHPGRWELDKPVLVQRKGDLIISGAGRATTITSSAVETLLQFDGCGLVRLQDLVIEGRFAAASQGNGLAGSLLVSNGSGLELERVTVSCAGAAFRCRSAVTVGTDSPDTVVPVVRMRDCQVLAGHAQIGVLLVEPAVADVEGCAVVCPPGDVRLEEMVAEFPEVRAQAGRLLIDDVVLGPTAEATGELLVGSPDVLVRATDAPDGRARYIVHLTTWGSQFITFTTTLGVTPEIWRTTFDQNPMPGNWNQRQAPDGFIRSRLRQLRAGLVGAMFSPGPTPRPVLTGEMRGPLHVLAKTLIVANARAVGGQAIVVGGRGSPVSAQFPEPLVLPGDPRPEVRITGNRIVNFTQGIHVATSRGQLRGVSHRVTVTDNEVALSVPSITAGRHGIFVGSVFHGTITGNAVELRDPPPPFWGQALPVDAIVVHGMLGPQLTVTGNTAVGTRRGVVATATNAARVHMPGWHWQVAGNAHAIRGAAAAPQTVNW